MYASVACAVGAVVKLALGSPNTVDEFEQRERREMPQTASPRREPRVAQPPLPVRAAPPAQFCVDKSNAELRRRQPPLLTMAHFRMSACLTRPVRLVRERELGDLGVVARPRERTQAGGRPTCGMTLRIKLYRDDRGPSLPQLARVTSNTTNPIIETVNTWVEGIHPVD